MKNNKNIESHVAFLWARRSMTGAFLFLHQLFLLFWDFAPFFMSGGGRHEDLARKEAKKILLTPGLLPVFLNISQRDAA
jgi:hypothetical protein